MKPHRRQYERGARPWVPFIFTCFVSAAAILNDEAPNWLAHHPHAAVALAALWAILNHLLPSPTQR